MQGASGRSEQAYRAVELPREAEIEDRLILCQVGFVPSMKLPKERKPAVDFIFGSDAAQPRIGAALVPNETGFRKCDQRAKSMLELQGQDGRITEIRQAASNGRVRMIELELRICRDLDPRFFLVKKTPFDTNQRITQAVDCLPIFVNHDPRQFVFQLNAIADSVVDVEQRGFTFPAFRFLGCGHGHIDLPMAWAGCIGIISQQGRSGQRTSRQSHQESGGSHYPYSAGRSHIFQNQTTQEVDKLYKSLF